jgi:hypothetical protein
MRQGAGRQADSIELIDKALSFKEVGAAATVFMFMAMPRIVMFMFMFAWIRQADAIKLIDTQIQEGGEGSRGHSSCMYICCVFVFDRLQLNPAT